jgi:hypothetical protein
VNVLYLALKIERSGFSSYTTSEDFRFATEASGLRDSVKSFMLGANENFLSKSYKTSLALVVSVGKYVCKNSASVM